MALGVLLRSIAYPDMCALKVISERPLIFTCKYQEFGEGNALGLMRRRLATFRMWDKRN